MTDCLPDLPRYIRQRDNEWQGADHPDGPWRPIPKPRGFPSKIYRPAAPESSEPASVAPEARPLSPAAQAVLDAFWKQPGWRSAIAAALRAVADQVVPEQPTIPNGDLTEQTYRWDERSGIRAEILAIAAELEGANA